MNLRSPLLEDWFNLYQPGARHQLGGTMIDPVPGERLAAWLPRDWSPALIQTGYSSTPGSPAVRERLGHEYGLSADHLFLTSGATEANACALLALLGAGRNLVLQDPLYYQFAALAEGMGVEVRRWSLPADPFVPVDLEGLWELLDDQTGLVVLNTPHNPTGRILSITELAAIARRVEGLPDAYLLVDEIYRGITADPTPSIVTLSDRGIAVNSLSKRWSLPGMRLGWAASRDREAIARMQAWHEHLTCSVSRLSEQMLEWLWPRRDQLWAEHQAIAMTNRARVERWLPSVHDRARITLPPAGVMTLLHPLEGSDDVALAKHLRAAHGLFLVPGSYLGYPGTLRFGFGHRNAEALEESLELLAPALPAVQGVRA